MHIIAVASGRSGSGKTLFLEKLVSRLAMEGCRVPVVKHIHHGGLTLLEGKDTERIFKAGAGIAAAYAGDLSMILLRGVGIEEILRIVQETTGSDVILAEGFRGQAIADEYIYIVSGPEDQGCLDLEREGKLLLTTSLSLHKAPQCPRFKPLDEAVEEIASIILSRYCQRFA
ncbi:MAG: molybdopterin-guanine dinucleotide biosynthesis protein MobB [Desulfurococcales archaeon]|nr:molybdopterin-guanine dinucleotide biosynthesis protein MobB [Desulfurococcales archaeon]MCE4604930.1 molybdopterin-guanine dinucleotide biosynthesis protein MobB [Desulfurococcales archaeon]